CGRVVGRATVRHRPRPREEGRGAAAPHRADVRHRDALLQGSGLPGRGRAPTPSAWSPRNTRTFLGDTNTRATLPVAASSGMVCQRVEGRNRLVSAASGEDRRRHAQDDAEVTPERPITNTFQLTECAIGVAHPAAPAWRRRLVRWRREAVAISERDNLRGA